MTDVSEGLSRQQAETEGVMRKGELMEAALVAELPAEALVALLQRAVAAAVGRPSLDCRRGASLDPRGLHGPR
jgi:hypothetical protein